MSRCPGTMTATASSWKPCARWASSLCPWKVLPFGSPSCGLPWCNRGFQRRRHRGRREQRVSGLRQPLVDASVTKLAEILLHRGRRAGHSKLVPGGSRRIQDIANLSVLFFSRGEIERNGSLVHQQRGIVRPDICGLILNAAVGISLRSVIDVHEPDGCCAGAVLFHSRAHNPEVVYVI